MMISQTPVNHCEEKDSVASLYSEFESLRNLSGEIHFKDTFTVLEVTCKRKLTSPNFALVIKMIFI